jgi:hypothetical protein
MKKISLKFSSTEIMTGHGQFRKFNTKRETISFLNDCSRFLTLQLYELRDVYAALVAKYTANWAYFPLYSALEKKIKNHLEISSDKIDRIIWESGHRDACSIVFIDMAKACWFLSDAINDFLRFFQARRANPMDIMDLNIQLKRISYVKAAISIYGIEYTSSEKINYTDELKRKTA